MKVKKNGVKIRPQGGYIGYFNADWWYCPKCNNQFFELAQREVPDPDAVLDFDFTETEVIV